MKTQETQQFKGHIEPALGDMLCIQYSQYEWGFSGDRFHSRDGEAITAVQHFANGAVRYTTHDQTHFRILRGTQLFHIK